MKAPVREAPFAATSGGVPAATTSPPAAPPAGPQIRLILDGLRQTGSSAALRAAMAQRQEELTRRARAMLEGSSHLHFYVADAD